MEPNKNVIRGLKQSQKSVQICVISGLKQSQKFVQISVISGLKIRVIFADKRGKCTHKIRFLYSKVIIFLTDFLKKGWFLPQKSKNRNCILQILTPFLWIFRKKADFVMQGIIRQLR